MIPLEIHPEILARQRYGCVCCGLGCRSFLVAVRPRERQSIEKQRNWREALEVKDLFVKTRAARPFRYGLAKRADHRCVFLNDDNLCEIHRLYGLSAKPIACRLFPFIFTPLAGRLRVGLRFDCTAVCQNKGEPLDSYRQELQQLAQHLVPPDGAKGEPPAVWGKQAVSADSFDRLNDALINIVASDAMPLVQRLFWLEGFLDAIAKVKWSRVPQDDFDDLIPMLRGGLLPQVQQLPVNPTPVTGKTRKWLGQVFFILSHPTTLRLSLTDRLRKVSAMHRLGRTNGPLPKLRASWPDVDLADLEKSFGPWPHDVEEMLTRYLVCRLGGLGYCGANFYNYTMVDGARSLLLAMVAIGWLMRLYAAADQRDYLKIQDACDAVMTMDGNLGYAQALAAGPARWRLEFLSERLDELINGYCR